MIVDDQRAKRGITFENLGQFKSEIALELTGLGHAVTPDNILVRGTADEFAVIQSRQRITFREARDLRVLMVGGDDNVIRQVERIVEARQFIGVIVQ